jgi:hypothetical protein
VRGGSVLEQLGGERGERMGNCHAVDPVCATVERASGKVEKLYFSASARQLMLLHPGHYVALVPPPPAPAADGGVVRVKRKLKLLPPDTMLNIGSCYRLVSFEGLIISRHSLLLCTKAPLSGRNRKIQLLCRWGYVCCHLETIGFYPFLLAAPFWTD